MWNRNSLCVQRAHAIVKENAPDTLFLYIYVCVCVFLML